MTGSRTATRFQPTSADFISDPYRFYPTLTAPVVKDGPTQWLISGHREVTALLRHPGLRGDWPLPFQQLRVGPGPTSVFISDILLHREGNEHAELRRALLAPLHSRTPAQLVELCTGVTVAALDEILGDASADLVPALAVAVPVRVTCALLDIPSQDFDLILRHGLTALNAFTTVLPDSEWDLTDEAVVVLRNYLAALADDPAHLLHRVLEQCRSRAPELPVSVLVHNLLFLLVAGFTTSVHLISSMLGELSLRPEVWATVGDTAQEIDLVVDEFARFSTPIQHVSRMAGERIELGGAVIRPGRVVHLLLAAANRDPAVFDRPDDLHLTRSPNPHVAFGRGLHACLGAQLGRIEAAAVLTQLRRRIAGLEATAPPTPTHRQVFRGYESVPVTFRSR